jgi:hypothetical protein
MSAVILWAVVAIAIAFLFVYAAARKQRRLRPPLELPPGESMPTTPLQRLAGRVLIVMLGLGVLAAAIVVYHGAQVYWDNDRVRLTVTGLFIATLAAGGVLGVWISKQLAGDERQLDEHDRAILAGASSGQGGAMLVTLAAWMLGLTEAHHDTHLVPSVYLYLMFWSCAIVSLLAWVAGIVLGYRRS